MLTNMLHIALLICAHVFVTVYATPYCTKPSTPFSNETDALNAVDDYLECLYHFFKADDHAYNGMLGFTTMWDDAGYMFNESTILDTDGVELRGYNAMRKSYVVVRSLMRWKKEASNVSLVAWSPFSVSFDCIQEIVAFSASSKTDVFIELIWFEDNSGIIKSRRCVSDVSMSGQKIGAAIVSASIATTTTVAQMVGYLADDANESENVENPIQFVFICVLSVLTLIVAVFVCIAIRSIVVRFIAQRKAFHTAKDHIFTSSEPRLREESISYIDTKSAISLETFTIN